MNDDIWSWRLNDTWKLSFAFFFTYLTLSVLLGFGYDSKPNSRPGKQVFTRGLSDY